MKDLEKLQRFDHFEILYFEKSAKSPFPKCSDSNWRNLQFLNYKKSLLN